ncbi:ribonuclease P protein component [Nitrosophilus labii]|uniref:ribonuclease P protein component n=1 Tax=Nitrosophilus labii TaxID=2706014 RepID=UPI001657366A
MKDFSTLKSSREFNYVYRRGKSWHSPFFVIFYKQSNAKKVGFVASKKIGNAVKRNRAKRRLKALFIEFYDLLKPGLYIFVAKKDILEVDFAKIKKSFEKSLRNIKLLKNG